MERFLVKNLFKKITAFILDYFTKPFGIRVKTFFAIAL